MGSPVWFPFALLFHQFALLFVFLARRRLLRARPVLEKVKREGRETADEREGRLRAVSRPIYGSQKFIGSISAIFKRLEAKSSAPLPSRARTRARAEFAEIFLLVFSFFFPPFLSFSSSCPRNKIVMSFLPPSARGSRAF